ncbi:uncharacterized protein ACWYII_026801 [Salvelinus alpinus]
MIHSLNLLPDTQHKRYRMTPHLREASGSVVFCVGRGCPGGSIGATGESSGSHASAGYSGSHASAGLLDSHASAGSSSSYSSAGSSGPHASAGSSGFRASAKVTGPLLIPGIVPVVGVLRLEVIEVLKHQPNLPNGYGTFLQCGFKQGFCDLLPSADTQDGPEEQDSRPPDSNKTVPTTNQEPQ